MSDIEGFSPWTGLSYDRQHTQAYEAIEIVARREVFESGAWYDEIHMRIPALRGRAEIEDLVHCPIGSVHNRTAASRLHCAKLSFVSIYYRHSDAVPMSKHWVRYRRREGMRMRYPVNVIDPVDLRGIWT